MKILLAALCIAVAGWGAVDLLDVDELVQRGRRGSGVCRRPVSVTVQANVDALAASVAVRWVDAIRMEKTETIGVLE